jgi:N-acetyl sugar amidotransferase
MKRKYQICTRCVMDTSDPEITFDENGICSYCKLYQKYQKHNLSTCSETELKKEIKKIKESGKGKKYDCVIGVSGGVDSSFVAYLSKKKFELRPLAVHLDNGWNSEISQANLERLLKKLDIDLYTYVIDWEEFKDLQLSFFKASVLNLENPTDHAIGALMYNTAIERGIKYIIHGGNIHTEGLMPRAWGYDCRDLKYIKSIHKRFGRVELKTFPTLGIWKIAYYTLVKKIRLFPILNYMGDYNKEKTKELLKKEFDWVDYGGKHEESIFTRFYQSYLLPRKFNIDKRKAHYSTLINSGQMTRGEALELIKKDPITDSQTQKDKEYVIRKFGLSPKEFDELMALPVKSYKDYPNQSLFTQKLVPIYVMVKKLLSR